ncbi:hypothetical protein [Pedobacter foliorum]|uniref:hypothetical protein n=1 Tax=Pedobacter foliorum TaxID=2739058 RepID=UPI001566DACE|nr:hypothetical protein [Pedobacter foliorum]NRF37480.1 hypothetical protein [Pedobacter foliorum]
MVTHEEYVVGMYCIDLNMSILIFTNSEHEEKVLVAFLDSLNYKYQSAIEEDQINLALIEYYTKDIEKASLEMKAGNHINHKDVKELLQLRKKIRQ